MKYLVFKILILVTAGVFAESCDFKEFGDLHEEAKAMDTDFDCALDRNQIKKLLGLNCDYSIFGQYSQKAKELDSDGDCKLTVSNIEQLTTNYCSINYGDDPTDFDLDDDGLIKIDSEYQCFLYFNHLEIIKARKNKKNWSALKRQLERISKVFAEKDTPQNFINRNTESQNCIYKNQDASVGHEFIPVCQARIELLRSNHYSSDSVPRNFKFSDNWKIGRNLNDSIMFFENKIPRPLFISFKDDRLKDEKLSLNPDQEITDGFLLAGDISYNKILSGSIGGSSLKAISINLSNDVDTSKKSEDSKLTLSSIYGHKFLISDAIHPDASSLGLTYTLGYETDRDFRRDIVFAEVGTSIFSPKYTIGKYYPTLTNRWEKSNVGFYWLPELKIRYRDIRDPGRNEKLIMAQQFGGSFQLIPKVSFVVLPDRWGSEDAFELSYSHIWDNALDVEHGMWDISYTYQLSKSFYFQLLYKRGRDFSTTEKIDQFQLGIGINN